MDEESSMLSESPGNDFEKAKHSRAAYLGHLVRCYKEVEPLMMVRSNKDKVLDYRDKIILAFQKLEKAHEQCIMLCQTDERDTLDNLMERDTCGKTEMITRINEWLDYKEPDDFAPSVRTTTSRRPSTPSTVVSKSSSTKRREARVKRELAELKLRQLSEKQQIEAQEQQRLEQQKNEQQRLEQGMIREKQRIAQEAAVKAAHDEIAQAALEEQLWDDEIKAEMQETDLYLNPRATAFVPKQETRYESYFGPRDVKPKVYGISATEPLYEDTLPNGRDHRKRNLYSEQARRDPSPDRNIPVERDLRNRSSLFAQQDSITNQGFQQRDHRYVEPDAPPDRSFQEQCDLRKRFSFTAQQDSAPNRGIHQQRDLRYTQMQPDLMVQTVNNLTALTETFTLPKPELLTFSGDPRDYINFITNFETNLASKVSDYRLKLSYLVQYCTGEAKDVIKNCVLLEPRAGYDKACGLLRENYGRPHVVARSFIDGLLKGQQVKGNDTQALVALSQQMVQCELTLSKLGYMSDLNSTETLKSVVKRLPNYMQVKWVEKAASIIERGVEPSFGDLCKFVQDRVKVATSVYGQELANASNVKVQGQSKFKGSKGAKVTTLATQSKGNGSNKDSKAAKSPQKEKPDDGQYVKQCKACNEDHYLDQCKKFKEMSVDERSDFVKQNKLCFNCLKRGHFTNDCKKDPMCRNCKLKHHTLLHRDTPPKRDQRKPEIADENVNHSAVQSPGVCLQIVPVCVKGEGSSYVETYALLDSGSTTTLCDERLLKQLNVKGIPTKYTITTVNGPTARNGAEVNLKVSCLNGESSVDLSRVRSVESLGISLDYLPTDEIAQRWSHLNGLTFPRVNASEVMLLIGNDVSKAFWVLDQRRGKDDEPFAVRYPLGWVLCGLTGERSYSVCTNFNVNFQQVDALQQQLEMMWKTDFADSISDSTAQMSREDKQALDMMQSTITMCEGKYQVALPFRKKPVELENNRSVAETRLRQLKKKLQKDEQLHQGYTETMQDYINKGHAKKIESTSRLKDDGDLRKQEAVEDKGNQSQRDLREHEATRDESNQIQCDLRKPKAAEDKTTANRKSDGNRENVQKQGVWYLPHHPVINANKPGKVRVVFDCAAKFEGKSLNDTLLQGPDLMNNLVGVLIRFRQEPVALVADIEAMFHQVKVTEEDCNFLRFLWWPEGDLRRAQEEYCMTVHLFGATSSPSCTSFCLKKTAEDNKEKYSPEATRTVERNFYVDDCLKSVPTIQDGVKLSAELRDLLDKGGFRLTKWVSNESKVLSSIPEKERAPSVKNIEFNEDLPFERALGLQWNISTDAFTFKIQAKDKPLTRRGILSMASSLYDPLGLVAPVTLLPKMLLQDLCRNNMGWDEQVDEQSAESWMQWQQVLPSLSDVCIPRCFKASVTNAKCDLRECTVELHHFADASTKAYGAASYLKVYDGHDNTKVNDDHENAKISLVMGKSRLAPMKEVTIPRLELSAAVVAVRLHQMIMRELELKVDKYYFWTDSISTLQYIRNRNKRFKTFVANRLTIIHDVTEPDDWYYVPTDCNPADLASRGIRPNDKEKLDYWHNGPQFLHDNTYPEQPKTFSQLDESELEVKATNATTTERSFMEELIQRHSSWMKLRVSIAWLLRFKQFCCSKYLQKQACNTKGRIELNELKEAEDEIIKHVQHQTLKDEIKCLKANAVVSKSSSISKLCPVLYDDHVRVGGRLQQSTLNEDKKHPVILPAKNHVSALIIRHFHEMNGHVGVQHVLSLLRSRYWIINGPNAVKREIGCCFGCKQRNKKPLPQIMAPLPAERLKPDDPPFSYVGVDFFGPLMVKVRRSNEKRYGCLFTCLTTRAVHIEITHSLDTDSFLGALTRFIARRGKPLKIFSDNGTNLTSGDRELRLSIQQFNEDHIHKDMLQKEIEWSFNPPTASHMGGIWERMIRSTRRILKALVNKDHILTDEALVTFVTEAEKILNDRPITTVSNDVRDKEPLSPSQLLLLKSNRSLPLGVFSKDDNYCRRWWRQAQYTADVFWRRWLKEYLPTLQARSKWVKPQENLKVGDIVLVCDENTPRGQWPLGRVIEVNTGRDGFVRSVRVRVGQTTKVRPVAKLCLLEQANCIM